jgi:hypothetical protein
VSNEAGQIVGEAMMAVGFTLLVILAVMMIVRRWR